MFKLTIDTSNAAFRDEGDFLDEITLAETLEALAKRIRDNGLYASPGIRDANGNTVGHWTYESA